MEHIEAEKSKPPQRPPPPHLEADESKPPQRPPRRLKTTKIEAEKSKPPQRPPPPRLTARVAPIPIPIPDRNPFDSPSPPIFRKTISPKNCDCCSYLFTNEGIQWNNKQLPVCFVNPTPRAPPTPSPESSFPNSPVPSTPEPLPSTPELMESLNEFFDRLELGEESPIPEEHLNNTLDFLFQHQAERHPQADNSPLVFIDAATERAPEFDLPEDIWDLFEN